MTISRKNLQELAQKSIREGALYTEIWNKHVDVATQHIQKLVLDAAALGRRKLTLIQFSNHTAAVMMNKWKGNMLFCPGVKYNSDYYATHIAEECLDDIVEKLQSIFIDCEIGVWYSGIQLDHSPKLLIKWQ